MNQQRELVGGAGGRGRWAGPVGGAGADSSSGQHVTFICFARCLTKSHFVCKMLRVQLETREDHDFRHPSITLEFPWSQHSIPDQHLKHLLSCWSFFYDNHFCLNDHIWINVYLIWCL